jgi:predicted RNase H-like nuclease
VALSDEKGIDWQARRKGTSPNPETLLKAASRILDGQQVTVVALDIPLSMTLITGRRQADNLISREYGSKGCSAHSPARLELQKVSRQLKDGFNRAGFPLATALKRPAKRRSLIEVFPHPALLALLGESYRIRYKVSKARSYWPNCSLHESRSNLMGQFRKILGALRREIGDIPLMLPGSADGIRLAQLKAYEDGLDALVCAWVGTKYLKREAHTFGDVTAAIWVPI